MISNVRWTQCRLEILRAREKTPRMLIVEGKSRFVFDDSIKIQLIIIESILIIKNFVICQRINDDNALDDTLSFC